MTEEDQSPVKKIDSTQADWLLETLVETVNGANVEIGITLNLGGLLISGNLASGKKYFAGIADVFSKGVADPESADKFRESLSKAGDDIYQSNRDAEEPVRIPRYIHLKNARFYGICNGPVPTNDGVWWRGRLSEVQGFCFSTISVAQGGN